MYNSISNFLHTEANQFKFTLRKSRFDALVDSSSKSILSNTSKLKLYIDTSDAIIPTKSNMILFGQEIKPKSLISSLFTYKNLENCQFIDIDGLGYASIYAKSILSEYQIIKLNVFSINYATGVLVYNDINYSLHQISVDNSSGIRIIIETLNDDIVISNNSVLYARDSDISISLLVE